MAGPSSQRPVFVGGCPRSGTTMLRTMLNSHPDLAMPHETRFLIEAWRIRDRWGDLSDPENRRRLARWAVERRRARVDRLSKDPDAFVEAVVAAPPALGPVLSAGFELYARRHGKPRWGDKKPSYVLHLDALFAMFPDAQFVNVVRDPRAAVASIRRIGWFEDGLAAGIELWDRSIRAAERGRERLGPGRFHELRYEDLVADPGGTLESLTEFLGLDPAGIDAMLAFHESADIKARRVHPLVRKPVTTAAVRSWEGELAPAEAALIERALAEPMRRHGYEPSADGVAVPAELRRRLRARRRRVRWIEGKAWLAERRLRLTYRRPVAMGRDALQA